MNIIKSNIIVCLVLLLLIHDAYSQTSGPKKQTNNINALQLSYWVPFSGTDARPMAEIVRKFNESQKQISVKMTLIEWPEYYPKLKRSIAESTAPDLAIAHSSILEALDANSLISDLKPYAKMNNIHWNDYFENTLSKVIRNNKYLAIPIDTHALVMYYNKTLLKNAGLLDERERLQMEPGIEGFMAFLNKLKNSLPEKVYPFVSATENIYPFWIWYAFYSQIEGGGRYIENGKAVFNNPQAKQALKVLVEMQDKGYWPQNIHDLKSYNLFKFDYAAIGFFGVWSTGYFEQTEQLNFGVMPVPRLFDKMATWGDSHTIILPKQQNDKTSRATKLNEKKSIAAIKFAKWVTDHGAEWAIAGHVPSSKEVVNSEAFQALPNRPDYSRIVDQINFYPNNPHLWECNEIMSAKINELLKGKLTVEEALNQAEAKINSILAN